MFSLITPTHDPRWLPELWASIQKQTYADWEWVLCPNGSAIIPAEIAMHPRTRVVPVPACVPPGNVGALKNFAFHQGKGDVLVEVDHDDLLTPDCLEKLAEAFDNPAVGFAYSDSAELGPFTRYAENCGWRYGSLNGLPAPESFPVDPRSLSFIWYSPHHVRAWRTSVYRAIGGHDPALPVCDDQDLLIRTYLSTRIYQYGGPLYIHREHGENTWLTRNALIQETTVWLQGRYAYALAERWSELNGLKQIDLGGAFDKPAGYLSVDRQDADVIHDLEQGLPFPDNSVGVIRAHDILEHLHNPQHIMAEIHRVLADGGWLLASVPSTDGRGAFQDPTHVSFWNQNSFWYWTRPQQARYIRNKTVRFQAFRLETTFPGDWHRENNIPYVTAHLAAVKSDERRPHFLPVW